MKLSRRDFVHAGCTLGAATLVLSIFDRAQARLLRGSFVAANNNNRVTVNADNISYLNLIKGFAFSTSLDPTTVSSDGCPLSTPSSPINAGSSPSMPAGYFGTFTWGWGGQASMEIISAPPMVVTSRSAERRVGKE